MEKENENDELYKIFELIDELFFNYFIYFK